jgi:Ca2+-transporting ATPase
MAGRSTHTVALKGLSPAEVAISRQRFGQNVLPVERPRLLFHILLDIVREPMFLLLVTASLLYFILGETSEGFMMIMALLFVGGISLYQDMRSTKALEALKALTGPRVMVIREEKEIMISSEELVPGDLIFLEEGNRIPADASIVQGNDLSVNESILTGESLTVEKHEGEGKNLIYQGTTVNSGSCYAIVTATGFNTVLGKLGKSLHAYVAPKTMLQKRVNGFVRRLALFGFTAFIFIWLINYVRSGMLLESLLFGLTLAMAAIPEEIPVAFTSFMALGAYQMSRLGIISRQPQTIENLGSITVICFDKTGTITENRMKVVSVFDFKNDRLYAEGDNKMRDEILGYAMLASEQRPFDVMEQAIHDAYDFHSFTLQWEKLEKVFEYPLEGRPPMMTHVYTEKTYRIAAAKGALERIVKHCLLPAAAVEKINAIAKKEAAKGYRILGIASAVCKEEKLPERQDDFDWTFEGFICLHDPPKQNAKKVLEKLYHAKIDVKLLTGDHPETALNIARQVGMAGAITCVKGDEIMDMTDDELSETVKGISVFARMFPEAKLRVIKMLQATGHIVAMTGDGVNDSPALQAADIGIAMGKGGTEMARQTADLVLTDDNLDKVVEAIRQGRKIFANLKKAVRYIISIHIPIILTAVLPLVLGWRYANLFTPVHIIFLELIMGPTCSVFFEREPVEEGIMGRPPRGRRVVLFEQDELLISIVQGLVIAAGVLGIYYFSALYGLGEGKTRAMVFTTLVFSNLFLTFANRSFTQNFIKTIRYKNNLAAWIWLLSLALIAIIHLVTPVTNIFSFSPVTVGQVMICGGVAFISVVWFELYKTNFGSG